MSSASTSPRTISRAHARPPRGPVATLLDSAFGLFVWAAHLLTIYITTAIACQVGLGDATSRARATFVTILVVITLATLALVGLHARRRYLAQRGVAERQLRMAVTIGSDAIASIAIAWQLLAVLLVPLCA
jgi:hypothetical protein